MVKFLTTAGITYELEELIKKADEKLVFISPYLKLTDRFKQLITNADHHQVDITFIYGKSDLLPEESEWLNSCVNVKVRFAKDLHAKCYLSENKAIITSMNFYEFSMVNNIEMGILVDNTEETYQEISKEILNVKQASKAVKLSVDYVPDEPKKSKKKGFCIRCGEEIGLDVFKPYCKSHYSSWEKYSDPDYIEKKGVCHICGKPNESSLNKPVCKDCYKENKNLFN